MGGNKLVTCIACKATGKISGHGGWNHVHTCPLVGLPAVVPGVYEACPEHNSLVFTVGPFSTYRACGHRGCDLGRDKYGNHTPWRGQAPEPSTPATADVRKPIEAITPEATPVIPEATPTKILPTDMLINLGSLGESIRSYVEARATEIAISTVTELATEATPRTINWTVNDRPFATIEGTHHKALPLMLKLVRGIREDRRNFYIVGPAGSGKTTLAHNLATALGLPFASISCTAGMSESALTGRALQNLSKGETSYQSTDFVRIYEGGGVFLLDEVDAADSNVMIVINAALANGHMPLPMRVSATSATRHKDTIIVCAANTWGLGADRQYVGRNQLDGAFLDRFVGREIEVDYDRDLEAKLVPDAGICARVWNIRDRARELKLRRPVGTRFVEIMGDLVHGVGLTVTEALLRCTASWTPDERTKVGVAS